MSAEYSRMCFACASVMLCRSSLSGPWLPPSGSAPSWTTGTTSSPLYPWEVCFPIAHWPASLVVIFKLFASEVLFPSGAGFVSHHNSAFSITSMSGVLLFLIRQAWLALRFWRFCLSKSLKDTRVFADGAWFQECRPGTAIQWPEYHPVAPQSSTRLSHVLCTRSAVAAAADRGDDEVGAPEQLPGQLHCGRAADADQRSGRRRPDRRRMGPHNEGHTDGQEVVAGACCTSLITCC